MRQNECWIGTPTPFAVCFPTFNGLRVSGAADHDRRPPTFALRCPSSQPSVRPAAPVACEGSALHVPTTGADHSIHDMPLVTTAHSSLAFSRRATLQGAMGWKRAPAKASMVPGRHIRLPTLPRRAPVVGSRAGAVVTYLPANAWMLPRSVLTSSLASDMVSPYALPATSAFHSSRPLSGSIAATRSSPPTKRTPAAAA